MQPPLINKNRSLFRNRRFTADIASGLTVAACVALRLTTARVALRLTTARVALRLTAARVALPLTAVLLLFTAGVAEAKYQICSITINSNDEIEAFKKFLPASEFDFHELAPTGQTDTSRTIEDRRVKGHYLKPYCAQKQRCDVLIISGHFGGTFTGTAPFTLSLEDMNSLSCSSACDGIFGAPKEVFLFGCNTLAGKTKDSRTPREYVQVLVDHGYPEAEARQISNLRYGPTGGTFLESMQRVFNRTPKIYGFDSVSPRGSVDAAFLKNYFKVIGDYKKHLDSLQMGGPANAPLKHAFRQASFLETSGRDSEERGLMCEILDPSMPAVKKVDLFERAMAGSAPLTFIPSIQKSIRENRELKDYFAKGRSNPKLTAAFENIRSNNSVKQMIGRALESLQVMLPTNAFDLMDFSQQMGWFSKEEVSQRKAQFYRQRLSEAKPESMNTLCELREYTVALEEKDAALLSNGPYELQKLGCLPLIAETGFFKAMTARLFAVTSAKNHSFTSAYQGWVFQTLTQNSALGKTFVELYLQQSNEIFFNPFFIQKGLETNAFFYNAKGVLDSLEKRIAADASLQKYRSNFSSLRE